MSDNKQDKVESILNSLRNQNLFREGITIEEILSASAEMGDTTSLTIAIDSDKYVAVMK